MSGRSSGNTRSDRSLTADPPSGISDPLGLVGTLPMNAFTGAAWTYSEDLFLTRTNRIFTIAFVDG